MTMGSRRSSDGDTSVDDLDLKNSISLEFDDYPLDLVSPLARDYDDGRDDPLARGKDWAIPTSTDSLDFGDPHDSFLTEDTYKFVDERDRFITDEIITDLGQRRTNEYNCTNKNTDVFVCNGKPNGGVPHLTDTSEDHYEHRPSCCCRLRLWLQAACKVCLSKYYTVPDSPAWYNRWRYALLCPPHGWLSHLTGLALFSLLLWGLVWTVAPGQAGPQGGAFALLVLGVVGFIVGRLLECIRFPSLVGMFAVGCLMKNISAINLIDNVDPRVAEILRQLGFAGLALRASLALTPGSLRQQVCAVLRLTSLPAVCEAITVTLTARLILNLPWLWAALLGCMLCASGPAVACPAVLSLQSRGYGLDKDIASLVVAASSVDAVLPLTGYAVVHALLTDRDKLVFTIFRGPLEMMGALIGAMIISSILWYIPHRLHPNVALLRVLLLVGTCYLAGLASWALAWDCVMPAGAVTLVFVCVTRWRKEQKFGDKSLVEDAIKRQWFMLQPIFYGLLGANTSLTGLKITAIGPSLAVIVIGCVVKLMFTMVNLLGTSLSHKEKLFVALTWLAKSTVQLSFGTVILLSSEKHKNDEAELDHINVLHTAAVLSVVTTLPLGGILTTFVAPYLLQHSTNLLTTSNLEKSDLNWAHDIDLHPELSKLRISEISNITTEIEITTERETVT